MRKRSVCITALLVFMLSAGTAFAGHGAYTLGSEGIKTGSLPPVGFYYKMYAVHYDAGHQRNPERNRFNDFDLDVFAMANRFIKVWDFKVLGADLICNAVIPIIYTDISAGPNSDDKLAFGDIYLEPLTLAWHGPRWDAVFGVGAHMPTGYTDKDEMAAPGKNYWTIQTALGGTWYFDDARTWSASAVARYEVHTKNRRDNYTSGDDFHIEWGLGKAMSDSVELGLAGYMAWQVKKDSGRGKPSRERYQGYAVGPEIQYAWQSAGVFFSLRSLYEFGVQNGAEGVTTVLSITKAF